MSAYVSAVFLVGHRHEEVLVRTGRLNIIIGERKLGGTIFADSHLVGLFAVADVPAPGDVFCCRVGSDDLCDEVEFSVGADTCILDAVNSQVQLRCLDDNILFNSGFVTDLVLGRIFEGVVAVGKVVQG